MPTSYSERDMRQFVVNLSPAEYTRVNTASDNRQAFVEAVVKAFLKSPSDLGPAYSGSDREVLRAWVSAQTHRRAKALAKHHGVTIAVIVRTAILRHFGLK